MHFYEKQKGGFDCETSFNNTIGTCWLSSSLMLLINNDTILERLKETNTLNKINYETNSDKNILLRILPKIFFTVESNYKILQPNFIIKIRILFRYLKERYIKKEEQLTRIPLERGISLKPS